MNGAESIVASYDPASLTTRERWSHLCRRIWPRSRRPVLVAVVGNGYLILALGAIGYAIGISGRPNLDAWPTASVFAGAGLLFPLRFCLMERKSFRAMVGVGPIGVEVARPGVTIRSRFRVLKVSWPGVAGLVENRREFALIMRAGDVAWVPRRAFANPADEARFSDLIRSGLAGPVEAPSARS